MSLRCVCIIPARLASTRFPRKLLEPFKGYPILEHVRRRAMLVQDLARVIVATGDVEIKTLVESHGGETILTINDHPNGTSRVAEAIENVDCTHVILVQGDEPLILPRHIEAVTDAIKKFPEVDAFNAVGPLNNVGEIGRASLVKCSLSENGRIIYCFRRSPATGTWDEQRGYMRKLLGLIAFRKDFLLRLMTLPETSISQTESIEQMKSIQHGFSIQAVELDISVPGLNHASEMQEIMACFNGSSEQMACFVAAFGHPQGKPVKDIL